MDSYKKALEAAGATVHTCESFGSYQGDWWAKVTYEGKTGWITGGYGSCSGCDAFESQFGWDAEKDPDYQSKLADFGRSYLDNMLTQEEAEKSASENISWDSDAEKMVKFIKENRL